MSPPSKARGSGAGMKVDESGWLESVAETDWAELRVEVWAEVYEEVRTAESEGDTEGWCEVSDETCWLVSVDEMVRMSVGDVGM